MSAFHLLECTSTKQRFVDALTMEVASRNTSLGARRSRDAARLSVSLGSGELHSKHSMRNLALDDVDKSSPTNRKSSSNLTKKESTKCTTSAKKTESTKASSPKKPSNGKATRTPSTSKLRPVLRKKGPSETSLASSKTSNSTGSSHDSKGGDADRPSVGKQKSGWLKAKHAVKFGAFRGAGGMGTDPLAEEDSSMSSSDEGQERSKVDMGEVKRKVRKGLLRMVRELKKAQGDQEEQYFFGEEDTETEGVDESEDGLGSLDASSAAKKKSSKKNRRNSMDESKHFQRSVVPESAVVKVEKSWKQIEDKVGEVGLKYFLRLFKAEPAFLELFGFGSYAICEDTGELKIHGNIPALMMIRGHAMTFMNLLDTCVANLSQMDVLVPELRRLGQKHRQLGIQDAHFDLFEKHFLATLKEEMGSKFDKETEEAWQMSFRDITSIMRRPSSRLETEPLVGWGLVMNLACFYFVTVSPFRLAGFAAEVGYANVVLNVLDGVAALCLVADICSSWIISQVSFISTNTQEKVNRSWLRKKWDRLILRPRLALQRTIRSWEIELWVPWKRVDYYTLLSFPLQYVHLLFPSSGPPSHPGLHWTQLFALIRLIGIARVQHALRCAENRALLGQRIDENGQVQLRIVKLTIMLGYVCHLFACLWCVVARVEMGPNTDQVVATSFFPEKEVLFGKNGVVKSYLRAVHWAWVNLAGIGNVESIPDSPLEVISTLLVHLVGAVFYAVVTGNVVSILEEATTKNNEITSGIAKLAKITDNLHVSEDAKERILQGYMMNNMLQNKPSEEVDENPLDQHEEVSSTLPSHIRRELSVYARAEALRQKEKFFKHCSTEFLFSLVGALRDKRTLLAGDYYMEEDKLYERHEVVMVEKGSMQVIKNGHTIHTYEKGDLFGKGWLLQFNINAASRKEVTAHVTDPKEAYNQYTDFLRGDGTAGLSIRATTGCTLVTGLGRFDEVKKFEYRFPSDFEFLRLSAKQASNPSNGGAKTDIKMIKGMVAAKKMLKHQLG